MIKKSCHVFKFNDYLKINLANIEFSNHNLSSVIKYTLIKKRKKKLFKSNSL